MRGRRQPQDAAAIDAHQRARRKLTEIDEADFIEYIGDLILELQTLAESAKAKTLVSALSAAHREAVSAGRELRARPNLRPPLGSGSETR